MQTSQMQIAKRRRPKTGLTLVEIVLALAVLAVALAGVIGAIMNSMTASALNQQLNTARDAAMARVDEVRARDFNLLALNYSTNSAAPSTWLVQGLTNGLGQVWLDMLGSNAICTVHVVITWTSERGNRRYETSTIVTR